MIKVWDIAAAELIFRVFQTQRFPSFLANVRRCIPSLRAVSEMLKPVSASAS